MLKLAAACAMKQSTLDGQSYYLDFNTYITGVPVCEPPDDPRRVLFDEWGLAAGVQQLAMKKYSFKSTRTLCAQPLDPCSPPPARRYGTDTNGECTQQ